MSRKFDIVMGAGALTPAKYFNKITGIESTAGQSPKARGLDSHECSMLTHMLSSPQ